MSKLNMQSFKQALSHDTLPEAVAQMEISNYRPPYVTQKELVPHDYQLNDHTDRQRWTRWPFLLLYGLIIALAAGLIGGFIG